MSDPKPLLTFTLEDLVYLATSGPTVGIRKSAAEALYQRGRTDGARETADNVSAEIAIGHANKHAGGTA
jgi:hypothetical protein